MGSTAAARRAGSIDATVMTTSITAAGTATNEKLRGSIS
jgi:hypothetical protein